MIQDILCLIYRQKNKNIQLAKKECNFNEESGEEGEKRGRAVYPFHHPPLALSACLQHPAFKSMLPFSLGKDREREVFLMSEVHLVFEQGGNCL